MTVNGYLQLAFYVVLLLLVKPLGAYMASVYEIASLASVRIARRSSARSTGCAACDSEREMRWTEYAVAVMAFNILGLLAVYALQRLQAWLPLNPQGMARRRARFRVQHGGELRHQHQLAGLRRRDDDELSDADAGPQRPELRLRGDRHGRARGTHPRLRAPQARTHRQLLGRSHADRRSTSCCPLSLVLALVLRLAGRRADASTRTRRWSWCSRVASGGTDGDASRR